MRIGLQPSEKISWSGDVLAGPYHPAFRELVESAVARKQMIQLIARAERKVGRVHQVSFLVPATDLSIAKGQKNSNIDYFRQQKGLDSITISALNKGARGFIRLTCANEREINLVSTRETMGI